jgi:quinol monooxygenase YgiN
MSAVAVIAKLTAAEGKGDELAAVIQEMVAEVGRTEPGTQVYAASRDSADPNVFWFFELYGDPDAAAAHSGGEALKNAGAKLAGLLAGRPEIHRLAPVAAHGLSL